MKKIGVTLLTAFIGGAVAIGGYKLVESQYAGKMSIDEKQKVYFTNNPLNVSSAGQVDFVQAAAVVTPAVVHIQTTYGNTNASNRGRSGGGGDPFDDMFRDFFGTPRNMQRVPQMASGSGVIVSDDGYIVTNNHVVENASKIEVILTDNRSFEGKVIGRDPNTDLALVKVSASNLPVVKIGNSDNVQIGEWVLAVGYPLTLNSTVTAGIVSAKGRSIGILGEQSNPDNWSSPSEEPQQRVNSAIESFIQTDAAINPGNSGGALVNAQGELIGINSAIASKTGTYEGYGFAIPINLAKKIMDDFIKFGSVKRGFVGVTFRELNASVSKELGVKRINGLYVNSVVPNGGAAAAGIKEGDIITKVDGQNIMSSADLQERVGRLRPGDKVQLTYERGGNDKTVTVTLKGEETVKNAGTLSSKDIVNKLGADFTPVSNSQKQRYGIESGLVVSSVREGGVFNSLDIVPGTIVTHINGIVVKDIKDISVAINKTTESKNNLIRIDGVDTEGRRIRITSPL